MALVLVLALSTLPAHAATWIVNNIGDVANGDPAHCAAGNANTCMLRDAIQAVSDGDTVTFQVGSNQTIQLTSNYTLSLSIALAAGQSITVDGSGSPGLTIDGGGDTTVLFSNGIATVANLQIANGYANIACAPNNGGCGGAIFNSGSLMLHNVVITGSTAAGGYGGAIYSSGSLTIDGAMVSGNSAIGGSGGGLYAASGSTTVVRGSSFSANQALNGAGIAADGSASFDLIDSTVATNTAAASAGGIFACAQGTLHLWNTTVTGNFPYGISACSLQPALSVTNSTLSGNTPLDFVSSSSALVVVQNSIFSACKAGTAAKVSDLGGNVDAGTSCLGVAPNAASKANAALNLGALADNGGTTLTMLPGPGSDAIDRGIDAACNSASIDGIDQRGYPRPQGTHCDAGAVEVQPCYVKRDAAGANDGTSWIDAYTDLQSALAPGGCGDHVAYVAAGVYKPTVTSDRAISFRVPPGVSVFGGYKGVGMQRDPMLYPTVLSGDIDGNDNSVGGIDNNASVIVGNNSYHVVTLDGTAGAITASTLLDGLTITGGRANATAPNDRGGGIVCNGSGAGGVCSPTLAHLRVTGNQAANLGGGLYIDASGGGVASPLISASLFNGNASANGGGAFQDTGTGGGTSSPTYVNVTFFGNAATYGGALYTHITSGSGTVTLTNVTSSANSSSAGGAYAEYSCGGTPTTALTNVILWGDSGPAGSKELVTICAVPTFKNSVVMDGIAGFGTDGGGNVVADPKLGALQDNGGATLTMMPGSGSSAISAGLDGACTGAGGLDQRDTVRPIGAHCDIGAVEATNVVLSVSDASLFGFYGKTTLYVVTLQNLSGTDTIPGIRLGGFTTAALEDDTTHWYCTASGYCTTAQQLGPLADTASLVPNGNLTWLVSVPVAATSNAAAATLAVHSNVAAAAQDSDTLAIFRSTFE